MAATEDQDHRSRGAVERRVVDLAVERAVERAHRRWAAEGRRTREGRIPKDRLIAELAGLQRGVVARSQLLAMGIGTGAITTRLRRHRLHPIHRGVYAVGHLALLPLAREAAAVLAAGPGSFVSYRSAVVVWHLVPARDESPIDVTVPALGRGDRPGLRVHRSRVIEPHDIRHLRGLPVASPARALIDFAEEAEARELERAVHDALARNLVNVRALRTDADRFRGRRGVARLRRVIDESDYPMLTRSEAEERFLALIRAAEPPTPEVNIRVGPHEVDFLWRDRSLVVEIDGFAFHSSRASFERDRLRDADLTAAGFRVIRVTWRHIVDRPVALVAGISAALRT
jgi:hypothetical protein